MAAEQPSRPTHAPAPGADSSSKSVSVQADEEQVLNATRPCPVVGVGASAGGIEAMCRFLDQLPAQTGSAYVNLLHCDPSLKSYAIELYSRHTPMTVVEASDGMQVEPNHLYVVSNWANFTVKGGRLYSTPRASDSGDQLAEVIERLDKELATRLRVEHALRESQSRLKVVFDTAAEGIITIDRFGIIDSFNPAAEHMFGYVASEVIGKNVSMLMTAPHNVEHDKYLSNYLKTGVKKIIGVGREGTGLRKNGEMFPIDIAVGEGIDGDGPIFTGIVRDISERKAAEAKLREADRMVSIGLLAAGLGHDMNNVLLPVRARLNALAHEGRKGTLPVDSALDIAEIAKSVAYLQQLADGLHFLAMNPEKDREAGCATNLAAWWAQAGTLISKAVPKHAMVTAWIPTDLPEVSVPTSGLTQAVLNLVVNAGAAIDVNQQSLRVEIKAARNGAYVTLGVSDNGCGMSEEVKRRAFDVFFTTKPKGLGTGLGLALVRKIVEEAGGSVEIESTLGKGTTVTMILPMVATAAQSRGESE